MRRRKRRRTDDTTLTLDALRAAVAWPALAAKRLDYAAALRRVPRGRVARASDSLGVGPGDSASGLCGDPGCEGGASLLPVEGMTCNSDK